MASAPIQPVPNLAQALEAVVEDGPLTFDEAINLVSGCKLTPTSATKSDRRSTKGVLGIGDMPLRSRSGTFVVQFSDVIMDVKKKLPPLLCELPGLTSLAGTLVWLLLVLSWFCGL